MPATVTCPNCNVTLKPKTPAPAGTRIKCPKCQTVFAVPGDEATPAAAAPKPGPTSGVARPAAPKPAPPEEEEEVAESADGADDAAEEGEAPVKAKKKGVPLWVWLVSGGAILLLGCCGVCGIGGYMAYNTVASAGSGSVTLLNYAKIQKGMSEAQVKTILGEPAVRVDVFGKKTATWKDGNNTITVIFTGDQATDRSCQLFTSGGTKIDQSGFAGQ
jgi:phage FluMu protein Com